MLHSAIPTCVFAFSLLVIGCSGLWFPSSHPSNPQPQPLAQNHPPALAQVPHQGERVTRSPRAMRYLITLQLEPPYNSFESVQNLPGFEELILDEKYGLVLISPKRNLYVMRVLGDLDPAKLMSIQPAIKGIHGDPNIAPFTDPTT